MDITPIKKSEFDEIFSKVFYRKELQDKMEEFFRDNGKYD